MDNCLKQSELRKDDMDYAVSFSARDYVSSSR